MLRCRELIPRRADFNAFGTCAMGDKSTGIATSVKLTVCEPLL